MIFLRRDNRRTIACMVAWQYLGNWYKWGGDDPSGFDCSGLVIEILKSVGVLMPGIDLTARDLFRNFRKVSAPYMGTLVFYNTPISHVEFCMDSVYAIGASGGGKKTLTVEDAIRDNAFIKIRPIIRQRVISGYADPFVKQNV